MRLQQKRLQTLQLNYTKPSAPFQSAAVEAVLKKILLFPLQEL